MKSNTSKTPIASYFIIQPLIVAKSHEDKIGKL